MTLSCELPDMHFTFHQHVLNLIGVLALLTLENASAATTTNHTSVVELFTSQGCNSCPPADALLGEIAKRPDVLALAYHVQYWDGLGWRDRFGLPSAEQRQYGYVSTLNLISAFTPQMVVNGQTSLVGSNQHRLLSLLNTPSNTDARISIALTNNTLNIDIKPSTTQSLDVWLVAYLTHADTAIPSGENAGKTLSEYNIVRELRRLGTSQQHDFAIARNTLPIDTTHIAVLLQAPNQGRIVDAVNLPLTQR